MFGAVFLFFVFRLVVFDGLVEGLVAEDRAVKFMFGEAAEVVTDFFGGDFIGVF